jgi:hypothetical protein
MKLKCTSQYNTRAFLLSMGIGLMMAQASYSAVLPVKKFTIVTGEEEPAKKNKTKSKAYSSRNNASVKIYPGTVKKIMHVVAKANNNKPIDFFVFDMQGTLMRNYKMKARDHVRIQGLQKGSYVYRVFCGDEETASGNFEIK